MKRLIVSTHQSDLFKGHLNAWENVLENIAAGAKKVHPICIYDVVRNAAKTKTTDKRDGTNRFFETLIYKRVMIIFIFYFYNTFDCMLCSNGVRITLHCIYPKLYNWVIF